RSRTASCRRSRPRMSCSPRFGGSRDGWHLALPGYRGPTAQVSAMARDASGEFSRPVSLTLSGFPELGAVTIAAPAYYGDLMYAADSTHPAVLQMALLTIFGATDPSAAGRTIRGDGPPLTHWCLPGSGGGSHRS